MIDLYKTLRLDPLESDPKLISGAIASLAAQQRQLDSKSAARVAKLIEFAKANLLSSARKAKYDREWQALYGGQTQESPESESRMAASNDPKRLDAAFLKLLPSGNPQLPFDRDKFLCEWEGNRSHIRQAEALAARETQELLGLLQRTPQAQESAILPNEALTAVDALQTRVDEVAANCLKPPAEESIQPDPTPYVPATAVEFDAAKATTERAPAAMADTAPASKGSRIAKNRTKSRTKGGTSSTSLARKIRRKKDRSLLMIAGGMLGSAAIVLATVLVLLNREDAESGSQDVLAGLEEIPINQAVKDRQRPVRGSGLGAALGGGFGNGGDAGEVNTQNGFGDSQQDQTEPANTASDMQGEPRGGTPLDDEPQSEKNSGMPMTSRDLDASLGEPSEKTDAVQISEQEQRNWRKLVTRIRDDLGQQRYNAAGVALGSLQELAKTEEQQDELGRLSSVATCAEEFHVSLMEAIRGLNAGSMIRVKSTELSFVEATESTIVFRIAGKNQRFPLTELPVGILEALIDLKLDRESASSKAKRAAFILLHPRATDLVKPRMLKLMREAEDRGALTPGTSSFFEVPQQ